MAGLFKSSQEERENTPRKKGDVIAEYSELSERLINNADKFISILNEVGVFFSRNFPKIKWGNDVAMFLSYGYNTYMYKKYLMGLYMKSKGYSKNGDLKIDESMYQTILAINWEEVRPFCEFLQLEGRNHDPKFKLMEGYEDTWHYIRSGAISINSKSHEAELSDNYKEILHNYCSITLETKEEANFANLMESCKAQLAVIGKAFAEAKRLQLEAQKSIPRDIPGLEYWGEYHARELDNIPHILVSGCSQIRKIQDDTQSEIYQKIMKCFAPMRNNPEPRCFDDRTEYNDLEIYKMIGYKDPNPDEEKKEKYPELYGPSIRKSFIQSLENTLESIKEEYKKAWYKHDQIQSFIRRFGYDPYDYESN